MITLYFCRYLWTNLSRFKKRKTVEGRDRTQQDANISLTWFREVNFIRHFIIYYIVLVSFPESLTLLLSL